MGAGGLRVLLRMIGPLMGCLPEIPSADRKIPLREKVTSAVIFLLILLVCSQIPLYGIHSTTGSDPDPDPLYWIRVVLASKRGTVMELGISPVVTYILVVQILIRSKIILVDDNHRALISNIDRQLLRGVIALGEAAAYVLGFRMFGSVDKLGAENAVLLILQLCYSGIGLLCVCEILWRGYFGPGIAPPLRPPFVPGRQWGRRLGVPLEPNEFAGALERFRIRRRRDRAARRRASREGPVPEGSGESSVDSAERLRLR